MIPNLRHPERAERVEGPAIDRLVLKVAGREGTLRQHVIWTTGTAINYIEEQALNEIAKRVEDHQLLTADLERLIYSWGMSSGKKAVRYIVVAVEKIADAHKSYASNNRKPTPNPSADKDDQKVFTDKVEAARFIEFLKAGGVHGWIRPFGPDKVTVGATNVHELFKTFLNVRAHDNVRSDISRGDPRPPSNQPPDEGATARLACPGADASQNSPSPKLGEGWGEGANQ